MPIYTAVSRCVSALMVAVLLVLTLSSHADDSSISDGVMILNLTTKDFDVAVAETRHLFVEFCKYATLPLHTWTESRQLAFSYLLSRSFSLFIF